MNNLRSSLNDVMKKRILFMNSSTNAKVQGSILEISDAQEFLQSLDDFYKVISINMRIDFTEFVRNNNRKLYMLRSSLVSEDKIFFQQSYSLDLINIMKRKYDRIYATIKYKKTVEYFERKATRMFTEFAKGITYFHFEFQLERNPIYHRNASCGSANFRSAFRFTKTLYGPKMDEYIKRCLIERMIYYRIYEHTLRLQDIGHKKELQNITIIYDSYFPNLSIKINTIDFSENGHPTYVSIGYYSNDILVIEETYTKDVGDNDVFCTKTDCKNNKYYEKIQTFSKLEDWIELSKPQPTPSKYKIQFE
jgi:hypothetical protein